MRSCTLGIGALVIALGLTLLTGCGAKPKHSALTCPIASDAPLALALSHRENSPEVPADVVEDIVSRFAHNLPGTDRGPTVSIVNVDGRPEVLKDGSVYFSSDAHSSTALDEDREKFVAAISDIVSRVRADDPEVDVVAALDQAAIAAGRDQGRGTLVFADSGLSTRGPLNFTQPGLLGAPPAEVLNFLARNKAIPNLKGLNVFLAVGTVARPQDDLAQYEPDLVELLRLIAERGGAACVDVIETPATASEPTTGLPPVSLVNVPAAAVFSSACSGLLHDAGDVAFEPGQATFREPANARKVLEPVAAAVRARACTRILLTGTTARQGSEEGQRALALQRANTVKALMVDELGADPVTIDTVGLGSYFIEYVPDNDPTGGLLPDKAALNRTVRIDLCQQQCPTHDPK